MPSTSQGIPLQTADATLVTVNNASSGVTVMGVDATASGGSVRAYLREKDVNGKLIAIITLVDGESLNDWYGPGGKLCNGSLFLDVIVGGTFLLGTVWIG